ncbi:MAG: hypothetical protein WCP99_10500 [Burkholderiales bacterium]
MAETIFSAQFEPASLRILKDPRIALWAGLSVEVWLFEDRATRGLLASHLTKAGARARVCSTYKPLLHYFLERAASSGMRDVIVEYPCHPQAVATRFLSEAYPLAELAAQGTQWHWAALEASTELPCYRLTWVDDRGEPHFDTVLAPNALRADHLGRACLVPCGYLRVTDPHSGRILIDEIIETEIEALFQATMVAIGKYAWGRQEPYFERLVIRADIPGAELYRDDGRLISSTLEALHEDLYFSTLEFFQHHSGRPPGDRGLQPGQIVPDVRQASPGVPASVCVVLHEAGTRLPALAALANANADVDTDADTDTDTDTDADAASVLANDLLVNGKAASMTPDDLLVDARTASMRPDGLLVNARVASALCSPPGANTTQASGASISSIALADVTQPVAASRVREEIRAIAGDPFAFESRQGRMLAGLVRSGTLPPVVVTGGQHANEASGVVGALRGAAWLAMQPGAHFACVPLENPDGYALFAEYRAIHPQHMHHAARYTGLGDDLEYREREPWYERAGRMHALAVTGAQLHLSLHGYPAHEWTRPFTGYLPRGFELWSVPKGYFLILRYKPGWKDIAEQFLGELTAALSAMPGLVDFNARQLRSYEAHAGELPFEVRHGIACMVSQNDRQTPGVVLVTEFPDETIAGEAFVFAHEVQTHTVRTATTIWWDLMRRERATPPQPQTI